MTCVHITLSSSLLPDCRRKLLTIIRRSKKNKLQQVCCSPALIQIWILFGQNIKFSSTILLWGELVFAMILPATWKLHSTRTLTLQLNGRSERRMKHASAGNSTIHFPICNYLKMVIFLVCKKRKWKWLHCSWDEWMRWREWFGAQEMMGINRRIILKHFIQFSSM